jgi:tetratricopeptide (TPR) repeat protein
VKKLAVIAVSLVSLASRCNHEDTIAPERWRAFEPRLIETSGYLPCTSRALQAGQVVPKTTCGPPFRAQFRAQPDACDDVLNARADTARMLATRPACTDRAIRELRRYALTDPLAPSDLAAAYYVRAQREDRPLDLLRALEAAEQAVVSGHPAALFNDALVKQTLGFTDGAIAAWDRFLAVDSSSQWAAEARTHSNRLVRSRQLDARMRWEMHRNALPAAMQKGDRAAVARFIAPFPKSAWVYFEEEVLGRWAEQPGPERLREARLYAEELSRLTKDRYAIDAVASLDDPTRELREGHLLHRDGIRANRAHRPAAAALFLKAATLLERAGSPVHLSSDNYHAQYSYRLGDATEECARRYPHLGAQVRATRGFLHYSRDEYLESLADYETALEEFTTLGDRESVTALLSSTLGIYRILGQDDLASIAAFRARDYAIHLPDPQRRNRLIGETAALALDLGHPRVALFYQNAIVQALQNELVTTTRPDVVKALKHNLAIALRSRAGIRAELDQFGPAMTDLKEAVEYASAHSPGDATFRALQARVEEVQARALLPRDPDGAIAAFSRAIDLAADGEYSTFRANLLVQRAAARRKKAGQRAAARDDLREALQLIRTEETNILEKRILGRDEAIWMAYFSRFDAAYDNLIRELMEDGRSQEAFAFAEQARAFEPMNLLLHFGTVAREFRRELGPEQILSQTQIQKHLPAGTFLVEYAVLEERTYAWIIGRNHFAVVSLRPGRDDVVRWSEDLQDAARRRDEAAFQVGLYAPYAQLMTDVFADIRRMSGGHARLVIIPDGAMHGLPFSALRDRASGQYLVQQATVSSAPSATFYIHSLLRDRELPRTGQPSALLYGNPAFDVRLGIARNLRPLGAAEREVLQVADVYGPRATVRTGAGATMTEFLRLLPHNEIAHVAAHGVVNARMPFRSSLLLARSPQHDGVMGAETLLRQMHAEHTRLMVLSACSSAGGLPVGVEGVAPLVRPILAAGVPGVIGTLWDVGDATSAELMVSFHRHYRQSSDAAGALHDAQVELLTRNKGAAPALTWAPFQVIGHASSPFAAPENIRGEPP